LEAIDPLGESRSYLSHCAPTEGIEEGSSLAATGELTCAVVPRRTHKADAYCIYANLNGYPLSNNGCALPLTCTARASKTIIRFTPSHSRLVDFPPLAPAYDRAFFIPPAFMKTLVISNLRIASILIMFRKHEVGQAERLYVYTECAYSLNC
jgi:hypothetical protein